jgi:thiamine pyrophosphate-dependent acetolactate synthase large subunit-like protein
MADGFSRATGEVVATSGTEGPGFTNMIMNIAAANAARTPLLVLASNMTIAGEDREAFIQTVYQQPTTVGMRKYGKRLIAPDRVHEYGAYAFRQLKSGVPGPVHLDFPAEVARARFRDPSELKDFYDRSQYRSDSRSYPAPADMKKAAELIHKAQRPLIVAGQGVFQRQGWDALRRVAEKNEIAVATSGPTRGAFPDEHRLCVMAAPDAMMSADLVVFVGQYCMPSPGEYYFNPEIRAIRVHPEQEDLGRNWPLDLGIVSDEALFLEALADALKQQKPPGWMRSPRRKKPSRITSTRSTSSASSTASRPTPSTPRSSPGRPSVSSTAGPTIAPQSSARSGAGPRASSPGATCAPIVPRR